jgi:hypothetical protein
LNRAFPTNAREPLEFGAAVMDAVTFCHVRARVENRRGSIVDGWGAISLSDFWAFPTPRLTHEMRDQVMRRVTQALCQRFAEYTEFAHPLDIVWMLEPELAESTRQFRRRRKPYGLRDA